MKHLFYIHSHITFLIANSVIAHLKIAKNDVAIILGRGYTPYLTLQLFRTKALEEKQREIDNIATYGGRLFWLRNQATLLSIDRLVEELTEHSPFVAYLPSNRNFLMQYLATHPNCSDLKLIEEGTMSYRAEIYKPTNAAYLTPFGKIKKWLKILDHGGRSNYYQLPLKADNIEIFGFHPILATALAGTDLSVSIVPLAPNIGNTGDAFLELPAGSSVLFFDVMVEMGLATMEQLETALEAFKTEMGVVHTLYVKFHPAQVSTNDIMAVFKRHGTEVRVIAQDVVAEMLLANSQGLKVYGFYTSLLLYASLFGQETLALYPLIEKMSSKAAEWRKQAMPSVFEQQVTKLSMKEPE